MSLPLASLSLDLDNKWSYLKTHGDRGWEEYPSYLDVVVPRFLELLRGLKLRITVFVVGQDAALEKNRSALASIGAAGHEIGNHSFHHEPWLHLYSDEQLDAELSAAEEAILEATGVRTTGFRGPGFSISPATIARLAHRGYQYDASTLPTFLGPLARLYYFRTAQLDPEEAQRRVRLFGRWRDGLQPIRPYFWQLAASATDSRFQGGRLLEIPVTTMPVFRVPFHLSYLLYLRQFSPSLAWSYWRLAMGMCRLRRVAPSLLLHPLDFLTAVDEPDLAFFPAMRIGGAEKLDFVERILADYARRYQVVPIGEYVASIAAAGRPLVRRTVAAALPLCAAPVLETV
jgi:peptidoglycan-N-acetylglucosamine deacetylase